jgi:pyridoxamine 5'-phosphate oxidase
MVRQISAIRKDYRRNSGRLDKVHSSPILQFESWFQEAREADIPEPNAMTLATVSKEGFPSARMVLLKESSDEGFVFYTNYQSRKGMELTSHPQAALVFWWSMLERQVRIEGRAEKISSDMSDQYFATRPKGSQIAAVVSPQSKVIDDTDLISQWKKTELQYRDKPVPRPAHWGGFILKPEMVEFWQGRANRLHDRIRYTLVSPDTWKQERLAP